MSGSRTKAGVFQRRNEKQAKAAAGLFLFLSSSFVEISRGKFSRALGSFVTSRRLWKVHARNAIGGDDTVIALETWEDYGTGN